MARGQREREIHDHRTTSGTGRASLQKERKVGRRTNPFAGSHMCCTTRSSISFPPSLSALTTLLLHCSFIANLSRPVRR